MKFDLFDISFWVLDLLIWDSICGFEDLSMLGFGVRAARGARTLKEPWPRIPFFYKQAYSIGTDARITKTWARRLDLPSSRACSRNTICLIKEKDHLRPKWGSIGMMCSRHVFEHCLGLWMSRGIDWSHFKQMTKFISSPRMANVLSPRQMPCELMKVAQKQAAEMALNSQ